MRLFLSVCAYVAFLVTVVLGGALGAHALLTAAPLPGFLESPVLAKTEPSPPPTLPAVLLKPYTPATAPSRSWTRSIGQAYVAKTPKTAEASEKPAKAKQKPRRSSRKLSREARDAYARHPSWPRGGF
jgi:hypothetical protein